MLGHSCQIGLSGAADLHSVGSMAEEFPFSLLEEEVEETLQLFREFEVAADGDALGEKVQDKVGKDG